MKKIMIAAAIVCAAVTSQAISVQWQGIAYALDVAKVTDNGTYSELSGTLYNDCSLSYIITVYSGSSLVDSASGTMKLKSTGKGDTTMTLNNLVSDKTYSYSLVLSGYQQSLRDKESTEYDYAQSTIQTILSGDITTKSTTRILKNVSSWDVSGIEAVPEPFSGTLALLGMGAIALRRKMKKAKKA